MYSLIEKICMLNDGLQSTTCCSTCVCPVEGALGVVGGAVVQGAVEGALIENGRHVAVRRQRRPQLRIYLPCVTGV